jgi:hypothetical protein
MTSEQVVENLGQFQWVRTLDRMAGPDDVDDLVLRAAAHKLFDILVAND